MQLNENTYQYMEKAASQIEGITCALAVYIENTGDIVREYHYKVYNDFVNDVREKQIEAIKTIKDIFCDTRITIESMASTICASPASRMELGEKLLEFEDKLTRLVIHSENIRKCDSSTDNPLIADADDDVYRSFAGYKRLITEYPLSEPKECEDAVSNLIYSYFKESVKIYEDLFAEYDKLLLNIGSGLETRRSFLTKKSTFYKRKDKLDIAKKTAGTIKNTVDIVNKVSKGDIFSAVDKSIGLCASLTEKYKDVLPKKSVASNMLSGITTFGKTMKLVESMLNVVEPDIKKSEAYSAVKLLVTASLMKGNGLNIHQMKEEGKLDVLINAADLTSNIAKITTTGSIPKRLLSLPKILDSGLGLYKSVLAYFNKDVQVTPKPVNVFLHNQAVKMKAYNERVKEYKQKIIQKVPTKKLEPPPLWMKIHKGVKFTATTIEKGGVIYDYAKTIL